MYPTGRGIGITIAVAVGLAGMDDTRPDEIDAREMSSRTRLLAGGECSGPH